MDKGLWPLRELGGETMRKGAADAVRHFYRCAEPGRTIS
jgi:hypothetical protein